MTERRRTASSAGEPSSPRTPGRGASSIPPPPSFPPPEDTEPTSRSRATIKGFFESFTSTPSSSLRYTTESSGPGTSPSSTSTLSSSRSSTEVEPLRVQRLEASSPPLSPISSPRRRKFPLLPPITTSGINLQESVPIQVKDEYPIFNIYISSSCRKSGNPSSFTSYLPFPLSSVHGVRPISVNLPPPHNITTLNNRVTFQRAGKVYSISVPPGSYPVSSLIERLVDQLNVTDNNDYRMGYNSAERKFTIQGRGPFALLFGEYRTCSIASTLGWENKDTITLSTHYSTLPSRLDENVGVCILLSRFEPRGMTTGGSRYCFRGSCAPGRKKWIITGSAPSREKEFKDIGVTLLDDYGSELSNWGEWSMELELQMVPRQTVRDASYVFGASPIPSRPSSPEMISSPRAKINLYAVTPSSPKGSSERVISPERKSDSAPSTGNILAPATFIYRSKTGGSAIPDLATRSSSPAYPSEASSSGKMSPRSPKVMFTQPDE